ncbi:MAG: hypothetical protein ACRD72_14615 [Candidatus Angelobacter sp.]
MRGIFHAAQSGSVRHAPQWKKCGKGQRPSSAVPLPSRFCFGIGRYARIPRRSLSQLCKIVVVLGPNFVLIVMATILIPVAMALVVAVSFPLALHFTFTLTISIAISVSLAFALAIPVSISVAVMISFTVSVAMAYGVSAIPGLCSNGKTSNSAAADGEN